MRQIIGKTLCHVKQETAETAASADRLTTANSIFRVGRTADDVLGRSSSMLRLLKRSRKSAPPSAAPAPEAAPELRRASGSASPVTPIQASPRHRPSAPALESLHSDFGTDSPAQRRDSDEFFESAIQELSGDDFLLSPAKVTVDDINSIQGRAPFSHLCS